MHHNNTLIPGMCNTRESYVIYKINDPNLSDEAERTIENKHKQHLILADRIGKTIFMPVEFSINVFLHLIESKIDPSIPIHIFSYLWYCYKVNNFISVRVNFPFHYILK